MTSTPQYLHCDDKLFTEIIVQSILDRQKTAHALVRALVVNSCHLYGFDLLNRFYFSGPSIIINISSYEQNSHKGGGWGVKKPRKNVGFRSLLACLRYWNEQLAWPSTRMRQKIWRVTPTAPFKDWFLRFSMTVLFIRENIDNYGWPLNNKFYFIFFLFGFFLFVIYFLIIICSALTSK